MKAVSLQCNYRVNPLGIDDLTPRLSWICQGGKKQSAYQITVRGEDGDLLWTSGKIETDRMHGAYDGPKLQSAQRVYWSVRLWDENGEMEDSESAWFEMGLLEPSDWTAQWIAGVDTDRKERLSADCFQKRFTLRGEVKRARLYATACGVYSAALNGARLPGVLAPGCTEYDKRLYYQV
jgi:alpha-L-rhamnosidase